MDRTKGTMFGFSVKVVCAGAICLLATFLVLTEYFEMSMASWVCRPSQATQIVVNDKANQEVVLDKMDVRMLLEEIEELKSQNELLRAAAAGGLVEKPPSPPPDTPTEKPASTPSDSAAPPTTPVTSVVVAKQRSSNDIYKKLEEWYTEQMALRAQHKARHDAIVYPPANDPTPYSTFQFRPSTGMNLQNDDRYRVCEFQNLYFDGSQNKWFFYHKPEQPPAFRTCKFGFAWGENFISYITAVTALPSSVTTSYKTNTYVELPQSAHNYHGMVESVFSVYALVAEMEGLVFPDPASVQFWWPDTTKFGGFQDLGSDMLPDGWQRIVWPSFSNLPIRSKKNTGQGGLALFRSIRTGGGSMTRDPIVGRHGWYLDDVRTFDPNPYTLRELAGLMLPFSEGILRYNNLPSKFLEVKEKEYIYILSRKSGGTGRLILNADQIEAHLREVFKDHPTLEVLPSEDLKRDPLGNMQKLRNVRVLIASHGQGESQTIFMRPGAILIEVNPYRMETLSFWTEATAKTNYIRFEHQTQSQAPGGQAHTTGFDCHNGRFGDSMVLNPEFMGKLVRDLVSDEESSRDAYYRMAYDALTDPNIYPWNHPHLVEWHIV